MFYLVIYLLFEPIFHIHSELIPYNLFFSFKFFIFFIFLLFSFFWGKKKKIIKIYSYHFVNCIFYDYRYLLIKIVPRFLA
jgi:hypothetical protein